MKKFVSWLLVAVLALGMCSWVSAEETAAVDVIDFEDGEFGFLGLWKGKANADASTLEVAEFNGSKALKITLSPDAKVPYVAFNIEGLLGERLADVAAVTRECLSAAPCLCAVGPDASRFLEGLG